MKRYGLICLRPGVWVTTDNAFAVIRVMHHTMWDSWEVYARQYPSRPQEWWYTDGNEIAVNLFTFRDAANTVRYHKCGQEDTNGK